MSRFKDKVSNLLGTAINVFGESIEYRPKNGGSFEIEGVLDQGFEQVDPDTETVVSTNLLKLGIRLKDLPVTPKQGDQVISLEDGKKFAVKDVQEDGQGGASLILHRSA